jgi:DNA-binding NarL/FixJ family response regulator
VIPPGAPRVLLVDDHALLAETIAIALRAEGVNAELAVLGSREDLVATVESDPPNLVLLDLELGGQIGDGATLVRPFVRAGARVLVVSATRRRPQIGNAVEQGAIGFVHKSAPFGELLDAALAATRGEAVISAEQRQVLLQELYAEREREASVRELFERLTPREQQVLRALGDGRTVSGIAGDWFVSEATVRSQVRGVLCKLGVGSQLEAVALAFRCGWLGETNRPADG